MLFHGYLSRTIAVFVFEKNENKFAIVSFGSVSSFLQNMFSCKLFLQVCEKPLAFLLQVYATSPKDEIHSFHRTLYFFICRSPECSRVSLRLKIWKYEMWRVSCNMIWWYCHEDRCRSPRSADCFFISRQHCFIVVIAVSFYCSDIAFLNAVSFGDILDSDL